MQKHEFQSETALQHSKHKKQENKKHKMDYSIPYVVRLDHLISEAELRSSVSVPPVSIRAGTISIFVEGNKL